VHFEKHSLGKQRNRRTHRGIEALEVPSLRDALASRRQLHQLIRLSQRSGQRLLDQDVDPRLHQRARYFEVMHRRRRHRSCAHFTVRSEHLRHRAERAAAEFARHRVGTIQIRIDHTHQTNGFALLLQFVVNPRVVASKDAHSHHRDGNRIVRLQEGTHSRPVAGRNEL
jgi:hypothetical protein